MVDELGEDGRNTGSALSIPSAKLGGMSTTRFAHKIMIGVKGAGSPTLIAISMTHISNQEIR